MLANKGHKRIRRFSASQWNWEHSKYNTDLLNFSRFRFGFYFLFFISFCYSCFCCLLSFEVSLRCGFWDWRNHLRMHIRRRFTFHSFFFFFVVKKTDCTMIFTVAFLPTFLISITSSHFPSTSNISRWLWRLFLFFFGVHWNRVRQCMYLYVSALAKWKWETFPNRTFFFSPLEKCQKISLSKQKSTVFAMVTFCLLCENGLNLQ